MVEATINSIIITFIHSFIHGKGFCQHEAGLVEHAPDLARYAEPFLGGLEDQSVIELLVEVCTQLLRAFSTSSVSFF